MSRTRHNRRKRFEYNDMYGTMPHISKIVGRATYRDFRDQVDSVMLPLIEVENILKEQHIDTDKFFARK